MTYLGQTVTQKDLEEIQKQINDKLLQIDNLTANSETPTTNGSYLEHEFKPDFSVTRLFGPKKPGDSAGEWTNTLTEAGTGENWPIEIQDLRADINLLETEYEAKEAEYFKQSFDMPEAPALEPVENISEIVPSNSYTLEDLLKEHRTEMPGKSDAFIIGWLNIHNPQLLEKITEGPIPSTEVDSEGDLASMAGGTFLKDHSYLTDYRDMMIKKMYKYDLKASFAAIKAYEDVDPIEDFQQFETKFREIPGNQEIPIEDVKNQYDYFVKNNFTVNKYWQDYALKLLKNARDLETNHIKNNPDQMARIEQLNGMSIKEALESGQLAQYIDSNIQTIIPGMSLTQGAQLGGWGGGKVIEKKIIDEMLANYSDPTGGKRKSIIKAAKKISKTIPYITSGFATSKAGYHLEHASNLTNNIQTLINPQPINNEQFIRINKNLIEMYTKWFDERHEKMPWSEEYLGQKTMLIENMAKKHINDNYQINRKTGEVTKIPLTPEEALDVVFYNAKSYASMASGLEVIDVIAAAALAALPVPKGAKQQVKQFFTAPLKSKIMHNAMKSGEDIVRNIPFYNAIKGLPSKIKFDLTPPIVGKRTPYGLSRVILSDISKIPKIGIQGTSKSLSEGLEEVLQSLTELRMDIHGPREYHGLGGWAPETGPLSMFSYAGGERLPELKIEKHKIWGETFDITQLERSFVGGTLGGTVVTTVQNTAKMIADHTNAASAVQNWTLDQKLNKSVTDKLIVKKTGPREFKLFKAVSSLNEKTGKMDVQYTEINGMKDIQSGGVIPDAFATQEEANQVAELYNSSYKKEIEKRIVNTHKNWLNSEAKITEVKEDGKAIVSIISSEGNVINSYEYKSKSEATKQVNKLNSNINQINILHEKYGEESISKASKDAETSQENINNAKQNLITDPNDGLDYNAEAIVLPKDEEKDTNVNLKNIENATEIINDEQKITPTNAAEIIEKNEFQKKPNKVLSKNYAKILLKGYMVGLKDNTGEVINTTSGEQTVLDSQLNNHLENADAILENAMNYPELFEELNIDSEAFIDNYKEIFDGHYNIEELNQFEETILSPEEVTQAEMFSPEELINPNEIQEFITPTEEIIYEADKVDLSKIVGEEKGAVVQEPVVEPTKDKEVVKKYGELVSAKTEIAKEAALEETVVTPEEKAPEVEGIPKTATREERKAFIISNLIKKTTKEIDSKTGEPLLYDTQEGGKGFGRKRKVEERAEQILTTAEWYQNKFKLLQWQMDNLEQKPTAEYKDAINMMKDLNLPIPKHSKNILKLGSGDLRSIKGSGGAIQGWGWFSNETFSKAKILNDFHRTPDAYLFIDPSDNPNQVYIRYIHTNPKFRRQGAMTELIDAIREDNPDKDIVLGMVGNPDVIEASKKYPGAQVVKDQEIIIPALEKKAPEVKVDEEIERKKGVVYKKDILTNTEQSKKKDWKWTKGQEKALSSVSEIITAPLSLETDNQRVISGYAGTGKTTIIENIIEQAKNVGFKTERIIVSAPTNKALSVLRGKLIPTKLETWLKSQKNFATLHRLFFGAPDKLTQQWTSAKGLRDYGVGDFIVIDEASMINKEMYKEIKEKAIDKGARVVFLGDGFQLAPIGGDPKILDKANVTLTEVKRQGLKSNILKWATQIRSARKFIIPNKSSGDVKLYNSEGTLREAFNSAIASGKNAAYITFSNPDRIGVNQGVRNYVYRDLKRYDLNDDNNIVIDGENLIGLLNSAFYSNGENFKAINPKFTGKIFKRQIWEQKSDPDTDDPLPAKKSFKKYTFYEIEHEYKPLPKSQQTLDFKVGDKEKVIITTLFSPDIDKPSIGRDGIVDLPTRYQSNPNMKNYALREDIGIATYGYAITGHKSQGSQWEDVYVNTNSPQFLTNPLVTFQGPRKGQQKTAQEMGQAKEQQMRWLYTTITRPSKKLYVISTKETEGIDVQSWDKIGAGASKASADAQYQLKPERGLVGIQSVANKKKVTQLVEMLYGKFEGAIGYKIIDNPDLKTPSGHYKVAWYSPKEKKVVINLAHADPTAPYHEYMHPFITEMRILNKDLYDNLLKDIINTPTGKELVYHIIDIYDVDGYSTDATSALSSLLHLTGGDINSISNKKIYDALIKYDSKDRKLSDEILAYSVSRRANDLQPSSNRFKEIVKKIIRWVRHKLFGPNWESNIYARSLDHNTTVDDLAKLLAHSIRRFTLEGVDNKLLNENINIEPSNIYQYMIIKKQDIESAENEGKLKKVAWMKNFFNNSWAEIKGHDKGWWGKRTKKEDFASVMVGKDAVLPPNMHLAFDMWYRRKFGVNKLPGKNRDYTPPESVFKKAINIVNNNDDEIRLIDDKGFADQREVPSGDLLFIGAFNTYVTEIQRNKLINRAKEDNQKFETWRKYALDYLKLSKTRVKWRDDAFRQYYNQLRSTVSTNKPSVALNGITNWTATINSENEFDLQIKGPVNRFEKHKQNPQIQKKTLADYYLDINIEWLSAKDMRKIKFPIDEFGVEMLDGPPIYNTLYGGLDEIQLNKLNIALLKSSEPRTLAFSRGDSSKYGIVKVTQEHKNHMKTKKGIFNYLQGEVTNGYITKNQAEKIYKDMITKPILLNAGWVASHEAKKSIYPRYMLDDKGLSNVLKRLKIMLTPVTVSEEGSNVRSVAYNPKQVQFVSDINETDLNIRAPFVKVPNMGMKYIGDGETIGSNRHFSMQSRHHGFSNKASVMKTVQYLKEGDLIFAKKHQVFRTNPNWRIVKKGTAGDANEQVLFIIDDKANINYGPAHPNYRKDKDNYIDELATSDEIKIGLEKFDKNKPKETYDGIFALNNGEINVPSRAIGFTKYEDKPMNNVRHPQQTYNYIDNQEIIDLFIDNYGKETDNRVRNALRNAITLKTPNIEKIAKLLETLDGSGVDDYIPMVLEHMRNGSGRHLANARHVDEIVQNKLVKPALGLENYNGSTLNVAMDNIGLLNEGEIGIPRNQAKFVLEQYAKANDIPMTDMGDITNEELTEWLSNIYDERKRGTYMFVSRFPVPHEGGSLMARVRQIHDRTGVITMHINDVLIKLEADNDGDHVEVELLPNVEMTRAYKEHFDSLEIKPIILKNYVDENIEKLPAINQNILFKTMSELVAGETAIGEISNVAAVYGSLRLVWEKFNINYRDIYIRDKNEYINFNVWSKSSPNGGKIPVHKYLRTYLQAALDNAEYGLLGKWNYSQDGLYKSLFKYKDGKEINMADYKMLKPLLKLHKMANEIRNGRTFKDGNFSLAEIMVKSREYLAYTEGRLSTLQFDFGIIGTLKNNDMTPIEYIATSPARMFNEMSIKNNLFGFKDSPYIISKDLHENAHIQAMEEMKIKHEMKDLDKAVIADGKTEKDKSYIKKELKTGEDYANRLGTTYYNIIKNPEELGPQAWIRNPELKSFMEDFWVEFNGLSNVAKFNATYHYLDGYTNLDTNEKGSHYAYNMVPTSSKKYQPTMLDHKLVNKYYKIYNNYVDTATNILSDNRSTPRGITDLINRYC